MRVLISGMGGELGTRVALLLEARSDVSAVLGIDDDPPRRRLRQARFERVNPRDGERMIAAVDDFDPEVVLHLGVMEPHARARPAEASEATHSISMAILGAAARCKSLECIVVRSGIEVYGRRRGTSFRPDESVPPEPTSPFGHSLLDVERLGTCAGIAAEVPVTMLRFAPIVGPHFPSPLGRLLRLPLVPFSPLADLPFSVLHQEDAAAAVIAAIDAHYDGAVNVVSPGAVTATQAARLGGRAVFPVVGPGWVMAQVVAEVLSAPLPAHVQELLVRGRTADGGLVREAIGCVPTRTTRAVIGELYEWASVTRLHNASSEAA